MEDQEAVYALWIGRSFLILSYKWKEIQYDFVIWTWRFFLRYDLSPARQRSRENGNSSIYIILLTAEWDSWAPFRLDLLCAVNHWLEWTNKETSLFLTEPVQVIESLMDLIGSFLFGPWDSQSPITLTFTFTALALYLCSHNIDAGY